ncbi:MAG: hypothetical protein IJV73_04855 [Clostridia bacterium]|nr:hypothetical protein [Clostridia bacterium]
MNTILYEVSTKAHLFKLFPAFFAVLFAAVLTTIMPTIIRKSYEKKGIDINIKPVKVFCRFIMAFILLWCILGFGGQWDMHNRVIGAYQRGEYQTVEGSVENFDPMPYEGHKDESFEINGVKFFYSDYSTHPGYNNAKSHGGVITGDGQHLKIGYVYLDEAYGNVIVFIEEIPE